MAYIRYRNGKFFVEIRRQGINPIYSSFIKKSDAKKFALQKEVEIQQKRYKDTSLASKILLRDLILEEKAKLKSTHRNTYKYSNLLKYSVCDKSLLELTSFDFAQYRDKRLSEGVQGGTVNRELSLISKTIKKAISEKNVYIPEFPITSFIRAKENPPKERRLYKGELEKILSEAQQFKNNYIVPCIIFSIETGMRLSEQTNLKWKDIDLDKGTAYLSALSTKTSSSRTVPLSSKAIETIKKLPIDINGRVFPISSSFLSHRFTLICRKLNLEDLTWHCLRREAVSKLLEKGLSISQVMRVSGHKTLKALQIYIKHEVSDIALKLA